MPRLPLVSGAKAVKALQRLGFFVDRQRGTSFVSGLSATQVHTLPMPV